MNPRLKSSKKWTAFPREYTEQILNVFRENFGEQLRDSKLVIEGRIYPEEVMLRVGIAKQGQLRQTNFEVSMDHSPKAKDTIERIHNCVDAAASMMMDFFENEEGVDFPKTWKEYPFQEKTIYLQSSTENTELEAEADRLLGLDDGGLLKESGDDEATGPVDLTGLTDDPEDEGPGEPRMFGSAPAKSKKKKLH